MDSNQPAPSATAPGQVPQTAPSVSGVPTASQSTVPVSPKSSSRIAVIVMVVLVVLLIVGGAGYYLYKMNFNPLGQQVTQTKPATDEIGNLEKELNAEEDGNA